jgi:hypothetical protein
MVAAESVTAAGGKVYDEYETFPPEWSDRS